MTNTTSPTFEQYEYLQQYMSACRNYGWLEGTERSISEFTRTHRPRTAEFLAILSTPNVSAPEGYEARVIVRDVTTPDSAYSIFEVKNAGDPIVAGEAALAHMDSRGRDYREIRSYEVSGDAWRIYVA